MLTGRVGEKGKSPYPARQQQTACKHSISEGFLSQNWQRCGMLLTSQICKQQCGKAAAVHTRALHTGQ